MLLLIPYTIVLLHLRVFYVREEVWTPAFIILGITTVKVILSFLAPRLTSSDETVVVLLGVINDFGFVAGAVVGFSLLRCTLGHLNSKMTIHAVLWALEASLVGVAVAWGALALADLVLFDLFGSFGVLLQTIVTGMVLPIGTDPIPAQAPLGGVHVLGSSPDHISGPRRFAP